MESLLMKKKEQRLSYIIWINSRYVNNKDPWLNFNTKSIEQLFPLIRLSLLQWKSSCIRGIACVEDNLAIVYYHSTSGLIIRMAFGWRGLIRRDPSVVKNYSLTIRIKTLAERYTRYCHTIDRLHAQNPSPYNKHL